jgi:hypothetical protein
MVEVCANLEVPVAGKLNYVGIGLIKPRGRGWGKLTTGQARRLADLLRRAADETEAVSDGG